MVIVCFRLSVFLVFVLAHLGAGEKAPQSSVNALEEVFSSFSSIEVVGDDQLKIRVRTPMIFQVDEQSIESRRLESGEELVLPRGFETLLFYRRDHSIEMSRHEGRFLCKESVCTISFDCLLRVREVEFDVLDGEIVIYGDRQKVIDHNDEKKEAGGAQESDPNLFSFGWIIFSVLLDIGMVLVLWKVFRRREVRVMS